MDTKICTRCNIEKSVEKFSSNKRLKSGLASRCKECHSEMYREWRIKNAEYKSVKKREWYLQNREHALQYAKDYVEENKDQVSIKNKRWYENNREYILNKAKEYYKNNAETQRKKSLEWKLLNRGVATASQRMRELAKRKATPSWLTEEQKEAIKDFYWLAKDLEKVSGEKYHVDHIIPIKGEDVCGLHVPWNLQVLPADINIAKGNRVKGEKQ